MANMLSWLTGREDKTEQPSPVQYDDGQPSLRAYNPSPSEQFSQWMAGLLGAGPGASLAKQNFATGVPNLLAASPLGIGLSAADLIHAKNANDPLGAAAAAIGMVPGLKPEVQAVRQGIRAFHGSPHDFNRFDLSKIGTGEGAQVYGHGLYFAENEGVAKSYRDRLSGPYSTNNLAARELYDSLLQKTNNDRVQAIKLLEENKPQNNSTYAETRQMLHSDPGHMYEVNINAKPEQFLDWDRALRDQPHIAQAMQDVAPKPNWFQRQMEGMPVIRHEMATNPESTGATAYGALQRMTGDKGRATDMLREAGIPGIRYLDQGSRVAVKQPRVKSMGGYADGWGVQLPNGRTETGFSTKDEAEEWLRNAPPHQVNASSNYVLFNDQLVDIMRKYGLAAPAAAGAASYAMAPQDAQATKAQAAQFQQPAPLSDRINQMIDSLQWEDQWQGRMRLPLERKVNNMLRESVWPPLR